MFSLFIAAPVSATEDPVLHTVQTVGRLSHKISRRVYQNVSRQIKRMQRGNINDYLSSLIAALKLHQYINFINSYMGTNVEQSIADVSTNSNKTDVSSAGNSPKTSPISSTVATVAAPNTSKSSSSTSPNAASATKRTNQNKSPNSTPPKAN